MERWRLVAGTAAMVAGRLVHDLEEFGTVSADWWMTGLLLPVALAAAHATVPGRVTAWLLGGWLVLNLVGAVATVLPLPAWPWDPAQTAAHYLGHAVYAVGTLPLSWWLWRDRGATVSSGGG